jgi:MFS transporter, UMF1 family
MTGTGFPKKNIEKTINAWCSYDIANSAYSLSISTVLYPIYYQAITKQVWGSDTVAIFGLPIKNTVLYDYAIALGYFMIIFLTPLLSGIADMGGYRKRFMQSFTLIGSMSCIGLYWFNGQNIFLGVFLPALAVIGFAGSLVYYNSFLPIIATPDKHDKISARGFSWGYAGSMLLLIFNLYCIENYQKFGFTSKLDAVRFAFIEVGIWWFAIAQIAFSQLKEYQGNFSLRSHVFTKGFQEIKKVFSIVKKDSTMRMFLLSFLLFSIGVQTIILVATLFGSKELGIEGTKLIITILLIQILALIGATFFGYVSTKKGNKFSLVTMLIVWSVVCFIAYFIHNDKQFFVLASLVGLVMGGIQSQARSTYSKLIPENSIDTASFFSFYDITEKAAIVIGMFCFGFIEQVTGSMRLSALLLSVFFLASLVIVFKTKLVKKV